MTWRATSGAVLGRDVAGAVAGAVVDDQHRRSRRRRPRPGSGRGRSRCSRPRCRRGRRPRSCRGSAPAAPAWRNSSQARPSSTAESWRELRARLRERSQDQDEEDEDREHGEAEDAAAVALLEREGGEQRVGDFGAGDERQPEPGEQQDQDVGVAQRAAADDRVDDQAQAEQQPGGAERRQFGGEDVCAVTMGRWRIGRRRPKPGSRRQAERPVSSAPRCAARPPGSPRRPAVTRTIGVAIATSSHHRRRTREQRQARPARGRRSAPGSPCRRSLLIASPTPLLHIRQTLRAVIAAYPIGSSSK